MSDSDAVASLFGQAARRRNQIIKMLLSEHRINSRLGNFSQNACSLRGVFSHEDRDVRILQKG